MGRRLGRLRGYGTLKHGNVHEKFNFSEMQELRPLRTCQKHFETILPNFLLSDECEIISEKFPKLCESGLFVL